MAQVLRFVLRYFSMSVISHNVSNNEKEKILRAYARLGLAAHGIVYCLMSLLSLLTALGLSNNKSEKAEAFKFIHQQPFGKVILFIIGACMLGYVLLRLFQAFKDTRHKGKGTKGIAFRVSYFFIALAYLSLSLYCFKLVFDKPGNSDGEKQYTQTLLDLPAGPWLVGGVALGFAIAAVYQIIRGAGKKFMKNVDLYDSDYKETFTKIGMIGYISRGVVFGIVAYLFLRAALAADSSRAGSTNGAFNFLRENFGNLLMAVMSVGLFTFGIFMFVRARHEKMNFGMSGKSPNEK